MSKKTTSKVLFFERQPGESARAFSAFCAYRDLHPIERSVETVAADLNVEVAPWAREHAWASRARSWDDYKDKKGRAAELRALGKMKEEEIELVEYMHILATDQIEKIVLKALSAKDEILEHNELRLLIAETVKLKKLLSNEPTEIVENRAKDEFDLSRLDTEELLKLKKIKDKLKRED